MPHSKNIPTVGLSRALSKFLGTNWVYPAVADYELGLATYRHITARGIILPPDESLRPAYSKSVEQLLEFGVLEPFEGLPLGRAFEVVARSRQLGRSAICALDPFAYLSHHSAMEHHGLTNRIAKTTYYTTPASIMWRSAAAEKMSRDLGANCEEYKDLKLPPLAQLRINRIRSRPVSGYSSSRLGSYLSIPELGLRVSKISQTFLEMLQRPDRCGGMVHVVETFEMHADSHLERILSTIDKHGRPIDKVRAGYILEEKLRIQSPTVASWQGRVQRGGSRKLDPEAEYDGAHYSERWCISINA